MRVLWFTNIELPAVRRRLSAPGLSAGAWMENLRVALRSQSSLQLGVAARGSKAFEPFEEDGVRYFHIAVPAPRGGFSGVADRWSHATYDSLVLQRAMDVVRRYDPDLIHVHGSEGPVGLLGEMVTQPMLVSLQGLLFACARFYLTGLPAKEVARDVVSIDFLKGHGLVHEAWRTRVAAERERSILQSCRFFAGRTEWDRGVLSVVNPDATYYHADELLRPEFSSGRWEITRNGAFVVYATGGDAPYKGLPTLLEAVALLRNSGRRNVVLRVGGQLAGTSIWPLLQRAVRRLGLSQAVEWLGVLSSDQIAQELRMAGVYVHPSLVDNSPNALAEAMMMGVPCVASSVGGIPSMIRDGEDGLLCAPNDAYSLAGRVAAIAEDPALAVRLGNNARLRAQRRHDPSVIAQATVAMYGDILLRHRAEMP